MTYFETPYHPVRAFLLTRATYLLLAGDLWLGMVQHAGRYGLGGFNVAHFAPLDALLPVHSPTPYVVLLMLSGCLSFALGLFAQPRWLRATLAFTYTLAWMISIHDSYQHHYFLSWLLAWLVAFPETSLEEHAPDAPVPGWGLPMTCLTCAIVYAFTGVAKSEAAWRRGDVLRALAGGEPAQGVGDYGPLQSWLASWGISEAALWETFAYATIALQWTIALGYVLAARRDAAPSRWRSLLVSAGLLGALSFHLSAEWFGHFEIGVFSYYMLGLALTLLGPLWLLQPIGRGFASIRQWSEPWVQKLSGSESAPRLTILLLLVASVGASSPLPGALWASIACASIAALRMFRARRDELRLLALQTAFCALAFWLVLTQSSMSFDYYRRVAGELRNMGLPERALESYRMAELYAPRGESRAREIRKLERALATERTRAREPARD
ncbi:MAG TPA: HTTM domain-containing protein [Polyangiales bacterium]|nr:HTTM domain-containing protein [Polyangiales bacterium]